MLIRMDTTALMERIRERLKAVGLSERKACLLAGLKVDAIRVIRRGHAVRRETLRLLAPVLQCPLEYLEEVAPDVLLNSRPEDEQRELLEIYQRVPMANRRRVLEIVRNAADLALCIPMEEDKDPAQPSVLPLPRRTRPEDPKTQPVPRRSKRGAR